jgi:amidase
MRTYGLLLLLAAGTVLAQVPEHYYRTFSHTNPVFLKIKAGQVVVTKTLDSGGQDYQSKQLAEGGNPLTGPFYIEGAEPGDAILVHLRRVRLNRNWISICSAIQ